MYIDALDTYRYKNQLCVKSVTAQKFLDFTQFLGNFDKIVC